MEDAIEIKSARLNLIACHGHVHQFCPAPIERRDVHANGIVPTENLIDRIGYSTDTLLDFKSFQHLEILGNEFGICVKGADKLFQDEIHRRQHNG
jgi:hypothetical protein